MPNIARCASALARVILFAAGFAVIATTADAVPAISPTGAARMEREKAEAQEQALKNEEACARMHARVQECRSAIESMLARQGLAAANAMPVAALINFGAKRLRVSGLPRALQALR